MKKVLSILFSIILIFSLIACQRKDTGDHNADELPNTTPKTPKEEPVTMWQLISEYDNIGFDFNVYLDEMRAKGEVVREINIHDFFDLEGYDEEFNEAYTIRHFDKSFMAMVILKDVEMAKCFYQDVLDENYGDFIASTPISLVRIDNTVIYALYSVTYDATGDALAELMNIAGIDIGDPIEINPDVSLKRNDTYIPIESIIDNMKEKGYLMISEDTEAKDAYDISICSFWNQTEKKSIDIYVIYGKDTEESIHTMCEFFSGFYPHLRIIYSINDEYGMLFMGNATDVDELWNSVKQ